LAHASCAEGRKDLVGTETAPGKEGHITQFSRFYPYHRPTRALGVRSRQQI
jgi:hypothetical protein